jgi:hypothetical protein
MSEVELLYKLAQWLETQEGEPTLFDAIDTGDGELVAAFILKGLRARAHRGTRIDGTRKVLRAFEALSRIWQLTEYEQLKLLGMRDREELDRLAQLPLDELPIDLIERISTLANIARSVRTLLPRPSVAAGWIRRPNRHALFTGRSALDLMLERDLEGMRAVRSYLLAEIYGR